MPKSKKLKYDNSKPENNIDYIMVNDIIMPFLLGCDIKATQNKFITHDGTYITHKDFKNCPIHDDAINGYSGYQSRTKKILLALGITDKKQHEKYLNKQKCNNLYQLLCHLYRDGNKNLGPMIDIIDSAKPKFSLFEWLKPAFVVGALSSAGAYIHTYNPLLFSKIINFLNQIGQLIISAIKTITNGIRALTLLSMSIHTLTFLRSTLNTVRDNKSNLRSKAYELTFALAATLLTLSSYAITYLSYGTMTATAGFIFIAASFVSVIKHSVSLYYAIDNNKKYAYKTSDELENQPAIEQAQYYRKLYEFRAERMALIQEVIVAVISTMIIASWSLALFFPPGIILVAASLGALIAVQSMHAYTSQKIQNGYTNELQEKLRGIDELAEAIELSSQNLMTETLTSTSKVGLSDIPKPTLTLVPQVKSKARACEPKQDSNGYGRFFTQRQKHPVTEALLQAQIAVMSPSQR